MTSDTRSADRPLHRPPCAAQDYLASRAWVTHVRADQRTLWYIACPNCKKKLIGADEENPSGECEKCNSTQQGTRRWILQATCNDGTGSRYVNFFDDTAVVMFGGKSADEVAALKNHGNQGAFDAHFANNSFKQYKMKVRIKSEQYNDENRLKVRRPT